MIINSLLKLISLAISVLAAIYEELLTWRAESPTNNTVIKEGIKQPASLADLLRQNFGVEDDDKIWD